MPDKKWTFVTSETPVLIKNCLVNSFNKFPCARGTIGCVVDHEVWPKYHKATIAEFSKEDLTKDNKTKATGEKD